MHRGCGAGDVITQRSEIDHVSAEGYVPRDELVYVLYGEIGRQAARFALRDDRTLALLTFRDADPSLPMKLDFGRMLQRSSALP